jgi:chromosome condensin MukBEF ATPase and DNA-binding subunit MukB
MAPSQAVWDALTPDERARVVAALPNEVTDAEIAMPEGDRHFAGTAMLLESDELIVRLEQMLDEVQQRAEEEARRREEIQQRAEEESRRREEAELEVARLREELARLER